MERRGSRKIRKKKPEREGEVKSWRKRKRRRGRRKKGRSKNEWETGNERNNERNTKQRIKGRKNILAFGRGEIFLLATKCRMVLEPTQPPIQQILEGPSSGIKLPQYEGDCSFKSSAEKMCVVIQLYPYAHSYLSA